MGGLNTSLLALASALALAGVGWLALQLVRQGFNLSKAGGNPRNRGQAFEALWDIGGGAVLILFGGAVAAFLVATLHFG